MNNQRHAFIKSPLLIYILSVCSLCLGTLVIIGWYTHNTSLIQVNPAFVPMQYNTALGFVFIGLALIAMQRERTASAVIFGGLVSLLGILTLTQYLFQLDFAIDQLFMEHYIATKSSHAGRMAPNTALCFSLSGIAVLVSTILNPPHRKIAIIGNLGAIVTCLGIVALIGYSAGDDISYGWMSLTKMAVHTSIGFILVGSAIFIHAYGRFLQIEKSGVPKWLISTTIFAGFTLTLSVWFELGAYEKQLYDSLSISERHHIFADESILAFGLLMTFAAYLYIRKLLADNSGETENISKTPSIQNAQRVLWLAVILGLSLSIAIQQVLHASFQGNIKTRFESAVNQHANSIMQGITPYIDSLYDIRSAFNASKNIEQAEFVKLTKRDLQQLPGLISLQWAPFISHDTRNAFEQKTLSGYEKSIGIRELNEKGQLIPAKVREFYYPVYFAEPLSENINAIGFDLYTNPNADIELKHAIEQNINHATGRLNLVQKDSDDYGFILNLPVYHTERSLTTADERTAAIFGIVVAVIDIPSMVNDVLKRYTKPAGLHIRFEDMNAITNEQFLFQHQSRSEQSNASVYNLSHQVIIPIADRQWRLTATAADGIRYPNWSWSTYILPAFTFGFSILLGLFLFRSALRNDEKIRLLREVKRSETRYSTLVDTIPGTVFTTKADTAFTTVFINNEVEKLSGYHSNEFTKNNNLSFFDITHPDDKNNLLAAIKKASLDKTEFALDYRIITKSNIERWVFLKGKPVYFANNLPSHIHATAIDITERKHSEGKFKGLLESAPDSMVIANEQGDITLINKQAEDLFGYAREELIGEKVEKLIPTRFKDTHPSERQSYFKTPTIKQMGADRELVARHKSGQEIPVEISLSPMKTADGMLVSAAIRDVTLRKSMEDKIVAALEKAEEATRAKSDFLANMSHEIRTPMNSIIGMSYLALQTDLTDKQRNYINKTHRSAESLLGIINDILDFSKIEAGKLDIENIEFNLNETLDTLSNIVGLKAEEKGIEFMFDIPKDVPVHLIGDPLRLGQILINLGNNAIKFTNSGEVVISIRVLKESSEKAYLAFTVKDTGIGMTEHQIDNLFQSFSQADNSTTRKFGGTGLGLAISKKLTELMNGEISVKSKINEGSEFTFTCEFTRFNHSHTLADRPMSMLGNLHVLVVDDNSTSRVILTAILESFGFNVDQCNNGLEAISAVKQANVNNPYQLVVMDWKMPEMDGIEATRMIQSDKDITDIPTFIMVTAFGKEEAVKAAKGVKLHAFLTKPVTPSTILDTLMNAMGKGEIESSRRLQHKEKAIKAIEQLNGANILLVEDNPFNQELAIEILTQNNILVEVANNGQEAIERLKNKTYDGVLMDCQMPIMDGYTATNIIRTMPEFDNLPILAMTANAMAGDKEKALLAGMNDHISKPVNWEVMFETMAKWIDVNGTGEIKNHADEKPEQVVLPQIESINIEKGLSHCAGSETLFIKLLFRFAKEQRDFSQRFSKAQVSVDKEAATRMAHTLKSASASLGMEAIASDAATLEKQCQQESGHSDVEQLVEKINTSLEHVIAKITAFEHESSNHPTLNKVAKNKQLSSSDVLARLKECQGYILDYNTDSIEAISQLIGVEALLPFDEQLQSIKVCLDEFDFEESELLIDRLITEYTRQLEN